MHRAVSEPCVDYTQLVDSVIIEKTQITLAFSFFLIICQKERKKKTTKKQPERNQKPHQICKQTYTIKSIHTSYDDQKYADCNHNHIRVNAVFNPQKNLPCIAKMVSSYVA